jgi:hypothetical protein
MDEISSVIIISGESTGTVWPAGETNNLFEISATVSGIVDPAGTVDHIIEIAPSSSGTVWPVGIVDGTLHIYSNTPNADINSEIPVTAVITVKTGFEAEITSIISISANITATNTLRSGEINSILSVYSNIDGNSSSYIGAINRVISINAELLGTTVLTPSGNIEKTLNVISDISGNVAPRGSINSVIEVSAYLNNTDVGVQLSKSSLAAVVTNQYGTIINKGTVSAVVGEGPNLFLNKAVIYAVVAGTDIPDSANGYEAIMFF